MMTQAEQLKLSGQLPSPRGVALAILELSRRENATLGEIARVVQTDPALSGRLIKLANTASHVARPVVSIQEAVVRQGMATVRHLALGPPPAAPPRASAHHPGTVTPGNLPCRNGCRHDGRLGHAQNLHRAADPLRRTGSSRFSPCLARQQPG